MNLTDPHLHIHLFGVGLVPAESRQVKPMPSFLKGLVPTPTDNNRTVMEGGQDTEKDTMPVIINKSKRTAWQVKKLAQHLKGKTESETLANDSRFVLDYIKYKKDDPLWEEIRSPRRLVWEGAGDCDCFSVFLAALLINQGIKFNFRIAKYDTGDWAHIYIIVPHADGSLTTLDPVTNKHDYQVPYKEKKDYDMNGKVITGLSGIKFLDGLGCNCGVPVPNTTTAGTKLKAQVVSAKSLEFRDITPVSDILTKAGLPYTKKNDVNGNVYYDVATPGGSVVSVAGFVSTTPEAQQKIVSDLLATPPPASASVSASTVPNITQTISQDLVDLTPDQKKTAINVLIGLGITAAVISLFRSNPVSINVGAIPARKKIARYKM